MGVKRIMETFFAGMQDQSMSGFGGRIVNTPMGPFRWNDTMQLWENVNNGMIMNNISFQDSMMMMDYSTMGGGGEMTIAEYDSYSPLTSLITISDYQNIEQRTASTLEFRRSIVENNRERYASPGSRVSFNTDATKLKLNLYWNAEIYNVLDPTGTIIPPAVNSVGAVLNNSTEIGTFSWPTSLTAGFTSAIFGLSAGNKTVTIAWPYAGGLQLQSIELNGGASISPASRPTTIIAVCGDSITQGFEASKITKTWPWLLGIAQDSQIINLGFAGVPADSTHANALNGITCDKVVYMIGFNDYAAQTAVNTFKNTVASWITTAYPYNTGATHYICSTIYSTFPTPGGGITIGSYRTAVQTAVTEAKSTLGVTNIVYVDGLSLMTNSADRLEGTVHPNDLGSSEIASNLDTVI